MSTEPKPLDRAKELINGERKPQDEFEKLMMQKIEKLHQVVDKDNTPFKSLRWPIWIGIVILSVKDDLDKIEEKRTEKANELLNTNLQNDISEIDELRHDIADLKLERDKNHFDKAKLENLPIHTHNNMLVVDTKDTRIKIFYNEDDQNKAIQKNLKDLRNKGIPFVEKHNLRNNDNTEQKQTLQKLDDKNVDITSKINKKEMEIEGRQKKLNDKIKESITGKGRLTEEEIDTYMKLFKSKLRK